ncbi:MAG TPA: glycyl-radical enzyme activating protein, partial [Candidatus Atribacteria bacterium]|nr:glycyl-radical enzyme activating protein [Candidatus Atribacteria bacterium]
QTDKQEMIFWEDRCIGCALCSINCPSGAISMKDGKPVTNRNECIMCGKCSRICPARAREIMGSKVSADDVIKEIEKDLIFYEESGGGATFSGGEPLSQSEFLGALLDGCKEKKIHTAVDTSGYIPWKILERLNSKIDLFLYDLKIMDDKRHKKYTGVSNKLILENLKKLSLVHHNIFIRFPIIPGINDDDQNIREMGEFLSSLKIAQINLLPYHFMGIDKYKRLERIYKLADIHSLSKEKLSDISTILRNFNLKVKLGG